MAKWLLLRRLVTLNKLKKLTTKLLWEKLDAYAFLFFWPLPHVTGTPPRLLRPVRVSTSSELYPNTWLFFFECLGIQFFNSLACDLPDTMPRQRLPTLIPREAEDFPRGDRHFKHVPPLTYLICLSPIELYMVGLLKPYSCSDLWRICSSWDLNFLHDKLSVMKVSCFIRLVTEPCDQW